MRIAELSPQLYQLSFEVGHAYLWRDTDSLTLIDTGTAGSGKLIARSIKCLGLSPEELNHVVLTHAHEDHAGAAAEIEAWGGVTVIAHRLEVPVIRGESIAPKPAFEGAPDWERKLYETKPPLPSAPPARVNRELEEGDVLNFGGGAHVLGAPGHTDGSIALYLPKTGVLFTGDAIANEGGRTMLGVFNTERNRAIASLRRLAELEVETACFGHGDPIVKGASAALREAANFHEVTG
ncbi:MBL fold metallo-hydrolase [Streptomyces sp. MUM 2J]|uniref:MBL fold metallo-hydrolase n=1 Tax=Streptomyces sp. MUM 2J TaxID=2791987 RepID=UPI001F03921D|nr:MBL fold metallo-hydrolase [Streptomyces sp. MUM 2J]MCH0567580.1 MBL fold metallo-hydrolase [Streptomyces sp. MUM 2J]